MDAPYIVSFMRASQQAMTINFRIEDSNGITVVSDTTVTLQALSDAVPSNCRCTMPTIPDQVAATYGQNYGSQCQAWDNAKCDELWGNLTVGAWCCRPWCYATSDCPDAYSSTAIPGQFFSYAACNSFNPVSPCTWTAVAESNDPCKCKNSASIFSATMNATFASNYGESCSSWDMATCATNYRPDQVDLWCCKAWCYVDKACPSAIQSLNPGMEGILFWSDNVCPDDPALVAQCPYKPTPNVSSTDTSCDCLNVTMPLASLQSAGLNASFAEYGQQCGPHDAFICDITYPGATHGMWCCMSWCWVDKTCPTARASTVWPGNFWSDTKCEMDAEIVSGCPWDLAACSCRQLPSGTLPSPFADNYGSSCNAWDSVSCKDTWFHNPNSGWNTSADHEWCCDSWCYVNTSCPIARQSWLGTGYYFSYETCDDSATTYNEAADTCDAARLLEEEETFESASPRLLSGRRRGGSRRSSSSGSWSSSSSRRRYSPPAPPTFPRRRSISRPTATYPRRRAPVSPRRRDVRRRAPPPPVPAPVATRRRTTSMSGNTYVTNPRRRAPASVVDTRRRRSLPYGYTSRPQMMNNYGGTMPQQTSYGYSGMNAVPANQPTNVAMYAVGGAVAGAVVGAGAMYAYNNMYGDAYDVHRRRRIYPFGQPDFCIVTAPGSRNGDFMECAQCRRLYGISYCPSANSCSTAAGCSYSPPQSLNRDDLAATGFIPGGYTFPLKVIFNNISGDGIVTDPLSGGLCPPTTKAEASVVETFNKTMSFSPELFLVLTKQSVTRAAETCDRDTTTRCTSSCWIGYSTCVNDVCLCQNGYCWDGSACRPNALAAAHPLHAVCVPLVLGLLLRLRAH
ncbi:unnamed protein product [Symbiodinium pilosum]|uniref:Uncharacterized protein n=1 Tax=Symbiodinium pilosum TaxID=2952 RepID=A0A812X7U1_SYMPI|nr:unnamed protein product [Symbiodinium pilosum]